MFSPAFLISSKGQAPTESRSNPSMAPSDTVSYIHSAQYLVLAKDCYQISILLIVSRVLQSILALWDTGATAIRQRLLRTQSSGSLWTSSENTAEECGSALSLLFISFRSIRAFVLRLHERAETVESAGVAQWTDRVEK